MYIYENHLGGLYASDYALDDDDLYCEQCGNSDWCIDCAETICISIKMESLTQLVCKS